MKKPYIIARYVILSHIWRRISIWPGRFHGDSSLPKKRVAQNDMGNLIDILILALSPWLFFWRLITPNPADRLYIAAGDFTGQYFPLRAFVAGEWAQGRLPLWNPYLYGGQPALADIQAGAFYPLHVGQTWLLGWLGLGFPVQALQWQVILHFSVAAVGMYLFMRRLAGGRLAGLVAAVVFTYSGYLTGFPVQQMTILAVSAWLPWLLWGLVGAWQRQAAGLGFGRSVAWGAGAFALALLAGHPQTVLYLFYLSLAYTLFRMWSSRRLSPLWPWLLSMAVGGLMASGQLGPTLRFIARSVRAALAYEAVSGGLPLQELIAIIYPGFLGGSPVYVGIAPLVLIGLALLLARPRREVFFWAGAMLLSLLLAFGGRTFLYPLFYLLAPGFEAVRQQERAFLVYSFSAAILSGYGALVLAGPLPRSARAVCRSYERWLGRIAWGGLAVTALYLYGSALATVRGDEVNLFYGVLRHHLFGLMMLAGMLLAVRGRRWLARPWGRWLLVGWLGFNLFTVNWQFNLGPGGEAHFYPATGPVRFLRQATAGEPVRIVSGGLLPGGNNAASIHGLEDLTGNTPLRLAGVETFFERIPAWRLWQLMNVRYVVADRDIGDAGLRPVFAEGDLQIFEIADPFPRAWFVSETVVIPADGEAIERLAADDFPLDRAAVIPRPLPYPLDEATSASVTVVEWRPGYLRAAAETSGDQLLVFSQIYYPGWQATLDGEPVTLRRVNVAQQGVMVPPGRHEIELRFRPALFRWSGFLSVAGLGLWLVLQIWGSRLASQPEI